MKDNNIYSSSALIWLLKSKYNEDIISLCSLLELTTKDIYEIQQGSKQLGYDSYQELLLKYDDLPLCDYDGSYKNPNWTEGVR